MARVRAPARRRLGGAAPPVPGAPPPPMASPGQKRYAAARRPPALRLPPAAPGPLAGAPGVGPPSLRGFACRLRRHRFAVSVPAPACWLGLSAPAAARRSAAAPGPPPPRSGAACGRPRRGPPALALGPSGRRRPAPGALAGPLRSAPAPSGPRGGSGRRGPPGRPLPPPALRRPSVGWRPGRASGSAAPARASGGAGAPLSPALRPGRGGAAGAAWGLVFRACGRGDSAACGRRARGPPPVF